MTSLEDLINLDKDKFQVFLMTCPGNLPFSFMPHHWFVINDRGIISRWEVLFRKIPNATRWGYLYKNFFAPFRGIEISHFSKKYLWQAKLRYKIDGEEAKQLAKFIEKSPSAYPYCQKYFLTGPNCNTYIQWIINHFPNLNIKLPWNAIGKNYKNPHSN
ncbi:MAG: DUF3750 domain-containing protein [bacterium]|nr:DUF3750 domain-containing protein [bacterium]